jgi:hypothetical protein
MRVAIEVDLEGMAGSLCHYSAHVVMIDFTRCSNGNVNHYAYMNYGHGV